MTSKEIGEAPGLPMENSLVNAQAPIFPGPGVLQPGQHVHAPIFPGQPAPPVKLPDNIAGLWVAVSRICPDEETYENMPAKDTSPYKRLVFYY